MLDVGIGDDGRLRIGWGEPDWFGPATWHGPAGATASAGRPADDVATLTIRASADVVGRPDGARDFARPLAGWSFRPAERADGGVPAATRAFGFQYAEFALPTQSDDRLDGWFLLPHRPSAVLPLGLVAPDGRTILLAPLDAFHDQVIGVADPGIAWGWHGDLESVPAGFSATLAVIAAPGPRAALDRFGALVRDGGPERPGPEADRLGRRVSYWTDNGAAYWYRTEPGHDTPATLMATVEDLRARGIPVDAVQLDSWFYPHEVLRPFDTDDWVVPPTGLVEWAPRPDVLPDGVPALRAALGDPPLVTHIRHLSSASPYVAEHECWVDGDRAHPVGPDLYERWLDQCVDWGVETFEHDWLVECFTGVRGLRAGVGRAAAWQAGIDRAAAARGLTLQWCMASPADFLTAAGLPRVTSIRTSGDHGYLVGPGVLWAWFLYVNALARPLGLHPFKDVFHADPDRPDQHPEVEALLSALSTGPVGLGDPLGQADRDLVLRTCRADGVVVRPDVPLAAIDATFRENPAFRPVPLVGECRTAHPAGRWTYVFAANCHDDGDPIVAELDPLALGGGPDDVRWDWRAGTIAESGTWAVPLGPLDWHLSVLAPRLAGGRLAVVGDVTRYAAAGRARLAAVVDHGDRVTLRVRTPGESTTLTLWSPGPLRASVGGTEVPVEGAGPVRSVVLPAADTARVVVLTPT